MVNAHALETTLVRRLATRTALRGAVMGWLTGALVAGGLLLLLRHGLRLAIDAWWPLWLLPVLLAAAGALRAWRRYRFSPSAAAALLDALGGCGGLLVAADLPGWGAWQQACRFPEALTVRWHEPRLWRLAALASLFAATVAVWPQRPLDAPPTRRMQLDAEVDRLHEQVAVLADTLPDDDAAQTLADQLEHLRETARADAPADAWETLDRIAERLHRQAAEAAETALNIRAELEPLATLAEALRKTLSQTPFSEALSQRLEQLAAVLDAAAQHAEGLPTAELAEALRQAFPDGAFDAAAFDRLAAQWRAEADALLSDLSLWSEARLIDPSMLQFCTNGMDRAAAEAALAACLAGGACSGEGLDGLLAGRFGISRGPGPAPLWIGDPIEAIETAGAPLQLPSSPPIDPDPMTPRRISAVTPETESSAPTAAGRLDEAAAGGGAAHRQTLLPRHRRVAAAYFATTE